MVCYNDGSQEIDEYPGTQKNHQGDSRSPVVFLCLLALVLTVKPLANVVADYACSDRQKEIDDFTQSTHPLPVARLGKGSTAILPHRKTVV